MSPNSIPSVNTDAIEPTGLEISLTSAIELSKLGLGTLVDIRQAFELDMKGRIPDTLHIPLFEVKQLLGHPLSENEQETLDAGQPTPMDVQGFFTTVNRLHHQAWQDTRLLGGAALSHAHHANAAALVARRQPQPGAVTLLAAARLSQLGQNGFEQVNRHKHVARHALVFS